MGEIYGDYWDSTKEVRELCLNCKYPDCFGEDGCPERKRLVARLKAIDNAWALKNGTFSAKGKMYELDGETKTLGDWCRAYGQKYATVWTRMQSGMSLKDALTGKAGKGGNRNRGTLIEMSGEVHCMSEWLRIMHIHRLTVVRYAKRHRCSMRDALMALCKRKVKNH